jgi:pyruvate formate lyase activating enzyme
MVERIRSTGMGVKLDTNGSRPGVIKELLEEGLIDFIAMDIKTQLARYPEVVRAPCSVEDIRSSIEEIKRRPVPREFRCTVVPGLVDFADLVGIASLLGEGETLILQQFRPLETLDPAFQRVKPYPDELLTKWSKELSGSLQVRTRGVLKVA